MAAPRTTPIQDSELKGLKYFKLHGKRIFKSKEDDHLQLRTSIRNRSFQPLCKRFPRMLPLRRCFFSRHRASRRMSAMFSGL